jgi:hypothetical protein
MTFLNGGNMKRLMLVLIAVGILSIPISRIAHAMQVMQTGDYEALGNALGDGISVTRITGDAVQFGTFTNGSGLWGIGKGIVLSSGRVIDYSNGPNTSPSFGTDLARAGHGDLDRLIPGYQTYDAATIEFAFTASREQARFNFVFASDEYPEWVGTPYNDVFGAFLGGVGGKNVSYDQFGNRISINSAWMYGTDPDNMAMIPPALQIPTGTELDGATVLLRTVLGGLTPGEEYKFMFGIADAGDNIYDSTVFISSFSGTSGEIEDTSPVPLPAALWLFISGLGGLAVTRKRFCK